MKSVSPQEDEAGPHPLSLSVSDYLTPSWSLSPSSSPLTHSEPSDSDREEDEEEEDDDDDDDDEEEEIEELRGRMLRRRKKRKMPAAVNSKKKSAPTSSRGPGRPCSSFSRPAPVAPPVRSQSQLPVGTLAPPTTNINNNININIGSSSGATVSRRQHCPYCGRHYRSLARHLEKHHANQPEVRTAMELAHLHTHNSSNGSTSHPQPSSSSASATHSHSFAVPQPSPSNPAPPSLFSRKKESPTTRSSAGGVSFSLSLSPPSSTQLTAAKKAPSLPLPAAKRPTPPMVSRVKSPSPPPPSPPRRGRRMKREKHEEQQKVESSRSQEELVPPPTPEPDIDPDEDLELSGEGEDDAPEEKNGETVRCGYSLILCFCITYFLVMLLSV